MNRQRSKFKIRQRLASGLIHLAALVLAAWGLGAVYFCFGLTQDWAKLIWMGIFVGGVVVLDWLGRGKSRWFLGGLLIWLLIPVAVFGLRSIDETWIWQTSWAREPEIKLEGNMLYIQNVRDFDYQKINEFDSRYTAMELDLNKIEGVLLGVSYWDGNTDIAHTMLGFYFSDMQALVISVETRKPIGASDSTLAGIYRQYGLLHVFGTAHDLWKLRMDYRKEDLYVYPTNATPAEARTLLLALCQSAEKQKQNPEFYNTILNNCTSSLVNAVRQIRPKLKFDLRFLFNGKIDQFAFENGWLMRDPGDNFIEVRRRAKRISHLVVEASEQTMSQRSSGKEILLDRNAQKREK